MYTPDGDECTIRSFGAFRDLKSRQGNALAEILERYKNVMDAAEYDRYLKSFDLETRRPKGKGKGKWKA